MTMRVRSRLSRKQQGRNMSWMLHQAKICVRRRDQARAEHLSRALQAERVSARKLLGRT